MSNKLNNLVAVYARVSTANQDYSMQLHCLRAYCEQRGFTIYKEYCDVGSGATRQRPALKDLMNDAQKKAFAYVLVFRFDRYARSTAHLLESLVRFRELGIGFISYNENIDTSSALGEAIFTIISAVSQLERDIIKERVVNGIANARAKGKILGRPQEIDRDQVYKLRSQGLSLKQIAEKLGTTKSGVSKILTKRQRQVPETASMTKVDKAG